MTAYSLINWTSDYRLMTSKSQTAELMVTYFPYLFLSTQATVILFSILPKPGACSNQVYELKGVMFGTNTSSQ